MQNGTRGCCHHDGAAGMEVDRLAVAPFVYLAEIAFRYTSDNNRNPSDECTNGRSRAKIMMFTSRELPRENVAHHHRYLSLSLSLSLSLGTPPQSCRIAISEIQPGSPSFSGSLVSLRYPETRETWHGSHVRAMWSKKTRVTYRFCALCESSSPKVKDRLRRIGVRIARAGVRTYEITRTSR